MIAPLPGVVTIWESVESVESVDQLFDLEQQVNFLFAK